MYPVGDVIRLYWADLDVWLSDFKVNELGEIIGTRYSSLKKESMKFYANSNDFRYNGSIFKYVDILIEEGLKVFIHSEEIQRCQLVYVKKKEAL